MFAEEIHDCKEDLMNEQDEYPSQYPFYAGRAMVASLKKNRLQMLRKVPRSYCFLFRRFIIYLSGTGRCCVDETLQYVGRNL